MITLRCRLWLLTISVYDPSAQTGYYSNPGPLPALILRPKNWKTDARKGGSCGSFRQSSFKTLEVQEMRDRLCQAETKSKIRYWPCVSCTHPTSFMIPKQEDKETHWTVWSFVNPQQRQKQQAGDAPCSKPTKGGVCNRFVFVEVEGLAGSTPFVHKKENEASSSSHTFNILARIIQESSIALYQLFPATAGASKMKCRRAILSEIGLHSGYNSFLLKQNEKLR